MFFLSWFYISGSVIISCGPLNDFLLCFKKYLTLFHLAMSSRVKSKGYLRWNSAFRIKHLYGHLWITGKKQTNEQKKSTTTTKKNLLGWLCICLCLQKQREECFKTQCDQQQNKMIVVSLRPTATSQETDRPEAAPRMSMQRLTEPAKEPDAAVRNRTNGLQFGVCFLWLASAAPVTPFSRLISKIWCEEFQ